MSMSTAQTSSPAKTSSAEVPAPDFSQPLQSMRSFFQVGRTKAPRWRKAQLEGLIRFCEENEDAIVEAMAADLGRPALEAFASEVAYVKGEAELALSKLKQWMAPKNVSTSLVAQPGKSWVRSEPKGLVLIIGPWNYPINLVLCPLIAALAAGNAVVIKPSELAAASSRLLGERLHEYVDSDCVRVIEGGVPETSALLQERFDHIFFTGGERVGRIVMTAAAKYLTPVTLELGGKSPCVIAADADLEVAAKRVVWGKYYNAGQTCVAPDYVLVEESVHEHFLIALRETIAEFYGPNPQASADYGRIINQAHYERLGGLLASGQLVTGGEMDKLERYLAPTVLRDVSPESPIMAEEIFGPILPVLPVTSMDQAISFIKQREKPLALYVFTGSSSTARKFEYETSSGGLVINHAWMHLAVPELPFGGVGNSGMGAYHGKHGFDVFSHQKAVLKKGTLVDPPFVYPPYDSVKKQIIKRLL